MTRRCAVHGRQTIVDDYDDVVLVSRGRAHPGLEVVHHVVVLACGCSTSTPTGRTEPHG